MSKPARKPDSQAVLALKERIAGSHRRCISASIVRWFIEQHEPRCLPVTVLEGPPCMIIVIGHGEFPVSGAARALFRRLAPIGMELYFIRGRPI